MGRLIARDDGSGRVILTPNRKAEDTTEIKKQRLKSMLENDHELLNEVVRELRREKINQIKDKL